MLTMNANFGQELARVSHEAVRQVHYDPKSKRPRSSSVFGKTSYFNPGAVPVGLQLSTDDPNRLVTRDLWSAAILALGRNPQPVPEFKLPPHVTEKSFVQAVMGWSEIYSPIISGGNFAPE